MVINTPIIPFITMIIIITITTIISYSMVGSIGAIGVSLNLAPLLEVFYFGPYHTQNVAPQRLSMYHYRLPIIIMPNHVTLLPTEVRSGACRCHLRGAQGLG